MINRLLLKINIFAATNDPFEILSPKTNQDGELLNQLVAPAIIKDTGILLRRFIIGAGVVIFIACLISILLIRNNERMYEEKKNKAIRVLVIVWLAESAITIFNIVQGFIEGVL